MNNVKDLNDLPTRNQKLTTRVLVWLILVSIIGFISSTLAYEAAYKQWQVDQVSNNMFIYENIGIACLMMATLISLVVRLRLRNDYWINLYVSRAYKLDERQLQSRHRVFSKAYLLIAPLSFIIFSLTESSAYTQFIWLFCLMVLVMPSIFYVFDGSYLPKKGKV